MKELDEAIKHAEEVAERKENFINKTYATFGEDRPLFEKEENECKKCAKEHRQLAEWLKELKGYRSIKDQIAFAKQNIRSENSDYLTGYLSALSMVEGMIAEIEFEESENKE